jgi:hypothetical protein
MVNSRRSAFAAPYQIIRRIRNQAPSRTISENWGRSGGFYGDEDESTSGYESVLIYVRRGLGRPEIIAPVIEFALEVQREYSARWTLIPLSYCWGDELKHMGTDIVMNQSMRADKITPVLCEVAGDVVEPGAVVVPKLFPRTDIRSLYQGKVRVTDRDLLVFVDFEDGPQLAEGILISGQMRRRTVVVSVNEDLDAAEWKTGTDGPVKRQTKEATLYQIKDWDFRGDGKYKNVIVREDLMDQILERLRAYEDKRLSASEKSEDNKDPGPLIDEQIWTFLFVYGYRNHQKELFAALTGAATVEPCEAWLEMLPMPARQGSWKEGSEGNSNIDLVAGSLEIRDKTTSGVQYRPTGPVCLVEAKWKSDIAGYTSHDPQRNQLARVIETAATLQRHTGKVDPADRFPSDVYVTLLTPRVFQVEAPPASRFYAYKYFEYSCNPAALVHDVNNSRVKRRPSGDWKYPKTIEDRLAGVKLRWVTFEDLYREMPGNDAYKRALGRFIHAQPHTSLLDSNDFPLEGE